MFKRSVSPNCKTKQRRHYRCEMNNGIYEGDILHYRKDGIGMFIHDEGSAYFGGFYQDNFHGEGVLLLKRGGILYGQFERGKVNGFACIASNENYVIGYFSQSLMNGRIYHYNSQIKFWKFCEYQQGKKIREISEEAAEDARSLPQCLMKDQFIATKYLNFLDLQIESIFKKNVNCSLSLLECEQNPKQKYIGYIDRQGNLNGLGCILTNDTLQMCGNYEDGKIQGLGRTLHDNGDIYDGFFRRDQMEGQGIYYTYSSNTYIYAYFKRNECIKIINGGMDYPVQLVKKMKQKIHEKSVEYLNGFINFKGIGISVEQIIKSIQEDMTITAKRQKNQYFDVSRCDVIEDEEQLLKRADFVQQEQSSRASFRKSANGSAMSQVGGAKLQIYNQNANRIISVQPFNNLMPGQIHEDNFNNQSNINQSGIIDIQDLDRQSPPRPGTSNSRRSTAQHSKIFTPDNLNNNKSKSPVLDKFLNTNYQKEMLSQSQRLINSIDGNNISQTLSDRTTANPKSSLRELHNLQQQNVNQSMRQSNSNNNVNISVRNLVNNQLGQSQIINEAQIAQSLVMDNTDNKKIQSNFNPNQSNQSYTPEKSKVIRSKIFEQNPISSSRKINNISASKQLAYQKELTFSPVRSQSQNGNYYQPNNVLNPNKSQQLSQSPSALQRSGQMSPVNQSKQLTSSQIGKKYPPIFQDTTQSTIRLSTTRQIQNSSFLNTYHHDDLPTQQSFNQLTFSPVKSRRLIFSSNRDHSAPILNSRIETPKLNTQLIFDRNQSPSRSSQFNNNTTHNESQSHNQKLKMQIGQSKYYSPSFNPQSLTLGDLIRSQQNSVMQQSPNRNSQNASLNNSQIQSSRQSNVYNQENRPNYSGFGLTSQRLNMIQGQTYLNSSYGRNQSPPSPLKSQKMKIFQDNALPIKRSQNLNLNVSFQDQTQDYQISDSMSISTNRDPLALKTSKFVVPNQLNQ